MPPDQLWKTLMLAFLWTLSEDLGQIFQTLCNDDIQ